MQLCFWKVVRGGNWNSFFSLQLSNKYIFRKQYGLVVCLTVCSWFIKKKKKYWHQYLKGFFLLHRRRGELWSSAAHSDAFESLKIYFPFRLTAVWDYNRALQEEDGEEKPSLKEPEILQDASLRLTGCKSNRKEGEGEKKRSSKLYAVGQRPWWLKSIYICKEI